MRKSPNGGGAGNDMPEAGRHAGERAWEESIATVGEMGLLGLLGGAVRPRLGVSRRRLRVGSVFPTRAVMVHAMPRTQTWMTERSARAMTP